jgi:hypothetical protein
MGSSYRLPNRYRGNTYPNRYPSNSPINRISMVTNNRNNSCIVASGVYTWVRHKTSTKIYRKSLQFSQSVSQLDDSDQLPRLHRPVNTYSSSSAVRVACPVSRNVTSDRSRSARTLVVQSPSK